MHPLPSAPTTHCIHHPSNPPSLAPTTHHTHQPLHLAPRALRTPGAPPTLQCHPMGVLPNHELGTPPGLGALSLSSGPAHPEPGDLQGAILQQVDVGLGTHQGAPILQPPHAGRGVTAPHPARQPRRGPNRQHRPVSGTPADHGWGAVVDRRYGERRESPGTPRCRVGATRAPKVPVLGQCQTYPLAPPTAPWPGRCQPR